MKSEKLAFGIITPSLAQLEPIQNFLDNAKKFGHITDDLIVCCYDFGKQDIINFFQKECKVTMIKRGHSSFLQNSLKKLGLSNDEIQILLGTPNLEKYGKVAYGTSRNYILLAAMFLGIDYLFFFDTDVLPKILYEFKEEKCKFKEIDFVGSHLKFLKKKCCCNHQRLYRLLHSSQNEFSLFNGTFTGNSKRRQIQIYFFSGCPCYKKNSFAKRFQYEKSFGWKSGN